MGQIICCVYYNFSVFPSVFLNAHLKNRFVIKSRLACPPPAVSGQIYPGDGEVLPWGDRHAPPSPEAF